MEKLEPLLLGSPAGRWQGLKNGTGVKKNVSQQDRLGLEPPKELSPLLG